MTFSNKKIGGIKMSIEEKIIKADKMKKSKNPITHHRVRDGEAYPAIINDCNMHKEDVLKVTLTIYPVPEGVEKEFFFNLKHSTYRLDNMLDMLNVEGDDLTVIIGKAAIIKIQRRERYEDLIVIKEISKETLCKEVEKLDDSDNSFEKEESKARRTPGGKRRVSPVRKSVLRNSRKKMIMDYEDEEEDENTDVEEIEDIDFSDEV